MPVLPGAPFPLSGPRALGPSGLAAAVFPVAILASQRLPLDWKTLAGIAVSQVMRR